MLEQRGRPVAILDRGLVRVEHETATIRVDQRVALPALDLLARVIASWPTAFGRLDALAVDNNSARARVAPHPLAVLHHQIMVDRLKAPGVTQFGEPAIDRALRRQVGRDQSPGTACAHHLENRVDDLAHRPAARPARGPIGRKVRRNHPPLAIRQIGLVSEARAAMLRAGRRGRNVFANLLESHQPQPLNPLSKRPLRDAIPPGAITISVDQAMQATGIERTKINQMMKDGTLDRRKSGRRTLITVESVRRLLN